MDKQYLWHPFTQMQDWHKESPIIIESGKGSYLIDTQRRKYLDGVSSLWVTVHGHRKKEIDAAVGAQLRKIAHSTLLGLSNVPAVQLAEKLVQGDLPFKLTGFHYGHMQSGTSPEFSLALRGSPR